MARRVVAPLRDGRPVVAFEHDHVATVAVRYGVFARHVLVERPVSKRDRLVFVEHADVVLRHHEVANQAVRDPDVQLRRDVVKFSKLVFAQPVLWNLSLMCCGTFGSLAK